MIDSKLTYAVIGASNNIEKYGYKVFKDFIDKGFNTIAINPNETEILGEICYSKLSDYDGKIDVAIFVLSPKFSLPVLEEIKELGIKKVWFQPGAESDEAIEFCIRNGIEYVANACIMI
ncbi:MAG TPA: CoA-binding protein, partial [Candidatus Absconditabacterales bacterium]|nr:CoA-binding protein [Candidatus Absconditabacterales bacterium]